MALEQRRGETDEEFEARKKRIKRLRQVPLNDKYAHARRAGGGSGGGSQRTNFCIIQGNDGIVTWYGATLTAPPFGTINPSQTVLGQTVYATKWKADGEFVMRFGDTGNEPIPDTPTIIVTMNKRSVALQWDSVNFLYSGNDLTLVTQLIADYVFDEKVCGYAQLVPNQFISYDFSITRGQA